MQSAHQLDLIGGAPPPADDRRARALDAARRLSPRFGALLPAAVSRALAGHAPRSALEGIGAHVVRVIDAAEDIGGDPDDARVDAVHRGLPAVYGASRGIARSITASILRPVSAADAGPEPGRTDT